MQSTDAFMREMGVLSSDQLMVQGSGLLKNTAGSKQQVLATAQKPGPLIYNKDLSSLYTPGSKASHQVVRNVVSEVPITHPASAMPVLSPYAQGTLRNTNSMGQAAIDKLTNVFGTLDAPKDYQETEPNEQESPALMG